MMPSLRSAVSLCAALLLMSNVSFAQQEPVPVTEKFAGKTYAQLAAGWTAWAMAIPESTNPIIDDDGSYGAIGQSGKVWYLAGNFGGSTARTLTVPSGTALFFPIVNNFWVNTPELGDPAWSPAWEAQVRQLIGAAVDSAQNLSLEIDGYAATTVYNLRAASNVASCVLPAGSIFPTANPGPHSCVADGYWALLRPLTVGQHTVRFAGQVASTGFSLDVTYTIIVKPRQKL